MILCLDCGNTRIKWAVYSAEAEADAINQGAVGHADLHSLAQTLVAHPNITHAIGCNVAGTAIAEQLAALLHSNFKLTIEWITASAFAAGVSNHYDKPEQLGADRWVGLVAAHALQPGCKLIVNAGTATTIDQIDAEGHFQGGVILPGLQLMRAALANNTAQLPLAVADYASAPRNTHSAIVSGTLEATAGAIERIFARLDDDNACCILSGGNASSLAPHLRIPVKTVDDLVLRGLAHLAGSMITPTSVPPHREI